MNTETRVPPHDLRAEEAFLGAALLRYDVIEKAKQQVMVGDFYKPGHQHIWQAMVEMHDLGEPVDVVTLGARLKGLVSLEDLNALQINTPSTTAAPKYANIVVETSRRRRLMMLLSEAVEECYSSGADEVMQNIDLSSDYLLSRASVQVPGLMSLNEFLLGAQLQEAQGKWLIPHVLRERWRVILVAAEGVGKGSLMRYMGLCAAAGRDWVNYDRIILPRKVLYVDLENPADAIVHQVKISNTKIDLALESDGFYDIWHREQGLNLRDRRDKALFEQVLQQTRPDIVFIGPLYKMFRKAKSEDYESVAIEVVQALDDLRIRYNFAVMIEHHAPKGDSSRGHRDLIPFGSATWMRWPDFGITLEIEGNPLPNETHLMLEVGRFRRDRLPADWPTQLERGGDLKAAFKGHFQGGRNRNNWPWGDEPEEVFGT